MVHDNKTIDPDGFLLANSYFSRLDFTGKAKFLNGTKAWYKNGKLHREDGPAVEAADESKSWHKDGNLHRDDGPAVEWADGSTEWWYDGKKGLENFPLEAKKNLSRFLLKQ